MARCVPPLTFVALCTLSSLLSHIRPHPYRIFYCIMQSIKWLTALLTTNMAQNYVLVERPMTWPDAEAHCVGLGGHLTSISSDCDNDAVFDQCTYSFLHLISENDILSPINSCTCTTCLHSTAPIIAAK